MTQGEFQHVALVQSLSMLSCVGNKGGEFRQDLVDPLSPATFHMVVILASFPYPLDRRLAVHVLPLEPHQSVSRRSKELPLPVEDIATVEMIDSAHLFLLFWYTFRGEVKKQGLLFDHRITIKK